MLRIVCYALVISALLAEKVKAVEYAGAGADVCITLTNDRAMATNGQNPYLIQGEEQWVLGFNAALSLQAGVEGLGGSSADVVFDQVEGTCSVHPDWSIAKAATETFNQIGKPQRPMLLER